MKIEKDKGLHFITGFFIYIISYVLFTATISAILVILAGILKEVFDQIKYKGADILDLFFTVLGGLVALFIFFILKVLN